MVTVWHEASRKWIPLVAHKWTEAKYRCEQNLCASLIRFPKDVGAILYLCTPVETIFAFCTTNPLTCTQRGLLAALCLTCSPCSSLPNKFISILFSRETQWQKREKTMCVLALGIRTSISLIAIGIYNFDHVGKHIISSIYFSPSESGLDLNLWKHCSYLLLLTSRATDEF